MSTKLACFEVMANFFGVYITSIDFFDGTKKVVCFKQQDGLQHAKQVNNVVMVRKSIKFTTTFVHNILLYDSYVRRYKGRNTDQRFRFRKPFDREETSGI